MRLFEVSHEVHHRSNRCTTEKGVDEWMEVCMQGDFVFDFESKQIINWKQSNVEYSKVAIIKTAICKLLVT